MLSFTKWIWPINRGCSHMSRKMSTRNKILNNKSKCIQVFTPHGNRLLKWRLRKSSCLLFPGIKWYRSENHTLVLMPRVPWVVPMINQRLSEATPSPWRAALTRFLQSMASLWQYPSLRSKDLLNFHPRYLKHLLKVSNSFSIKDLFFM